MSHDWVLLSPAKPDETSAETPFFRDLEELPRPSSRRAVVLAVEGMRPIGDDALDQLAGHLDAAIFRLRPRGGTPLRPEDAPSAVAGLRAALHRIQVDRPSGPSSIHVVTTAPVALLIELGRLLVPTVYRSVVVHQFDPQSARYVPVFDVVARRVL